MSSSTERFLGESDWFSDSPGKNCTKCSELSYREICKCMDDPLSVLNVDQQLPELKLNLVTYIFCISLGIFWNLITLFVKVKGDRKNRSVTNIFLISLAVADLLLVSIAAPMELVHYFAPQFGSGGSGCKLAEYSRVLSAIASIFNLLAVTIERFIVIVFPMRSRSLCTMTNSRRVLVAVWGMSMILALPVIFTKSVYDVHYANNLIRVTVTYCNDYDDALGLAFSIYQLIVSFALPGIIMVVCYSTVIFVLWKSTKRMAALTNSQLQRKRSAAFSTSVKPEVDELNNYNKREDVGAQRKQVIKMLICVVCMFFLCWGPRFVMEIVIKSKTPNLFYPWIYWTRVIIFLLPFVHACINPIIYIIMSKNFRKSVIKLSRKQCSFRCGRASNGRIDDDEIVELKGDNADPTCTTVFIKGDGTKNYFHFSDKRKPHNGSTRGLSDSINKSFNDQEDP